jgi:phosphate butyryltransferase
MREKGPFPIDQIAIGETATVSRAFAPDELDRFDETAATGQQGMRAAAAILWEDCIAAILRPRLHRQKIDFLSVALERGEALVAGAPITLTARVSAKESEPCSLAFDCQCVNESGALLARGEIWVELANGDVSRSAAVAPAKSLCLEEVIIRARTGPPLPAAIAHPCSPSAISAALDAAEAGLIVPILVGPEKRIRAAAAEASRSLDGHRIVPTPHSHASADQAVALVRAGEARLLVKGSLHTDELMSAVVSAANGLRTERRISHAYVMDVADYTGPLIITDAAINIAPTLTQKADIVRNAIDLAHVVGLANPRVAILSAVETVNPDIPSTLDAAALCKMADRGQIEGGVLDGPLALDNAISVAAAREKGIVSTVAGRAEILVVPNLEAGNMLAKQLTFLGDAEAAGVVLGARVPIVLTSRADSERTRLASCALAALLARAAPKAAPGLPGPSA